MVSAWAVDGQKKGKKKASDVRHDAKNPDVFNDPRYSYSQYDDDDDDDDEVS